MSGILNFKLAVAGLAAALAAASFVTPAAAQSRGYCDRYARDVADDNANAGDVLAGTIGGALTGALIGGAIGHGKGAGQGAIIGGVGGTVLGGAGAQAKWRNIYDRAYFDCMSQQRAQPVYGGGGRFKPGSRAWFAACSDRYRSFNPDTGLYLSSEGGWRPCRL
ncbi:hypothetical protein BH10PSE7_BH10PSE7_41880 [soil metagenome]